MEELKKFLFKGYDSTVNNGVKALLIGAILGAIFGFVGRDLDFDPPYGFFPAIIAGVIVTLSLFLKYNTKTK